MQLAGGSPLIEFSHVQKPVSVLRGELKLGGGGVERLVEVQQNHLCLCVVGGGRREREEGGGREGRQGWYMILARHNSIRRASKLFLHDCTWCHPPSHGTSYIPGLLLLFDG